MARTAIVDLRESAVSIKSEGLLDTFEMDQAAGLLRLLQETAREQGCEACEYVIPQLQRPVADVRQEVRLASGLIPPRVTVDPAKAPFVLGAVRGATDRIEAPTDEVLPDVSASLEQAAGDPVAGGGQVSRNCSRQILELV